MSTKKSKKQKKKKSKKTSSSKEATKKRDRSRSRSEEHRKKKRKSYRKSRSPPTAAADHRRHSSYHRSRSNSRSRKYRSNNDEFVEKIDKKKLLEIAKANVINAASLKVQYTNVNTTVNILTDNSAAAQQQKGQGTKSINELVEYCKKISNDVLNDDDDNNDDKMIFHHPFETKEVPFSAKVNIIIKIKKRNDFKIFLMFSSMDHLKRMHQNHQKKFIIYFQSQVAAYIVIRRISKRVASKRMKLKCLKLM